jgi:hypothetical protein
MSQTEWAMATRLATEPEDIEDLPARQPIDLPINIAGIGQNLMSLVTRPEDLEDLPAWQPIDLTDIVISAWVQISFGDVKMGETD